MVVRNRYEIKDDTATLTITRRNGEVFVVIIDPDDVTRVKKYSWSIDLRKDGYTAVQTVAWDGSKYAKLYMSRFIIDPPLGMEVDHININPLDNRKDNLRVVTRLENSQNLRLARSDNKSSGLRGVSWNARRRKWMAYLTVKGKRRYLGYFIDLGEANDAVTVARASSMPFSTN